LSIPPISRRHFLGGVAAVGGTALAGCSADATSNGPPGPGTSGGVEASPTSDDPADQSSGDGILVLINLDGGNDGLNTVCPVEDGRYRAARGGLALDPAATHALSEGFALHPALSGCKALWDRGRLAVVHGVGFAELDRSHFHCRDVWQSGDPSSTSDGWVGRWLDTGRADVLRAVAVDRLLPLLLRGAERSGAVVPPGRFGLPDEARLRPLLTELSRVDPDRPALAAAVAASTADLLELTAAVSPVLAEAEADDGVGAGDALVARLDTVAALIDAGLGTRVYTVQLGGFDTHAGQAPLHADLLGELDRALTGFLARVAGPPVTVAVWSEFGRRLASNASGGTDHGKGSVVLVAGQVAGGHHGDPPPLDRLDDGDLATTVDFRSVLGGLAEGVLGLPAADVVGSVHRPLALV
jgi:uncharacterized protein (DUF1501 family)